MAKERYYKCAKMANCDSHVHTISHIDVALIIGIIILGIIVIIQAIQINQLESRTRGILYTLDSKADRKCTFRYETKEFIFNYSVTEFGLPNYDCGCVGCNNWVKPTRNPNYMNWSCSRYVRTCEIQ